jgi:hypothetical protein
MARKRYSDEGCLKLLREIELRILGLSICLTLPPPVRVIPPQ